MTEFVHLSMVIETDQAPEDVQLAVLATLSDRYKIASTHVYRPDDTDRTPQVAFVICPLRGLLRVFVDNDEDADLCAREEGAVVVNWSADADYRGETRCENYV